jgi:hypothetical protein
MGEQIFKKNLGATSKILGAKKVTQRTTLMIHKYSAPLRPVCHGLFTPVQCVYVCRMILRENNGNLPIHPYKGNKLST